VKTRKSVMKHQFSQVPKAEIPRSSFDRSHGHKTTFDAGFLIPILVDEVLPGDGFNLSMTGFARLATPIFPIMDNMYMDTHFFFVPNRLIWDNWEKFNGEQTNPGDSTDFLIPRLSGGVPVTEGQNGDYMGIPTDVANVDALNINALHFRALNLIYNEWFRDQNLVDSVAIQTDDGPDSYTTNYASLYRRGKRHDYFTSCLPFPQKGDSVDLPLGTVAPITGIGAINPPAATIGVAVTETGDVIKSYANQYVSSAMSFEVDPLLGTSPNIFADLSSATAATINQLRQAFQIQKLLERDARGGTRYTEIIRAHFGVTSPDARLQRPEYLGGGSSPVIISPIAQTSNTSSDVQVSNTPQGNLAAIGTVQLNNHGFTKSFTEHGVLIGLVSTRADLTYQTGLDRGWSRQTRFDYYWPALAQIGEQAVLQKEIFLSGVPVEDDVIFGYQERFAEYRYKPSKISGLFRSTNATTLDAWHLAQDFLVAPVLNKLFIEENPPVDRVIAVQDEPHFIFDAHFSMRCARPMPLYGVPGYIDHF